MSDCTDGTDELEESCGQLCADSLLVSYNGTLPGIADKAGGVYMVK